MVVNRSVSFVFAVALVVACQSAPPSVAPPATFSLPPGAADPCALIGRGEIENAFGGNVAEPQRQDKGGAFVCLFRGIKGGYVQLSLDQRPEAASTFDVAAKSAGSKSVSGIGDKAYSFRAAQSNGVLVGVVALKGKATLGASMTSSKANAARTLQAITSLLKAAIPKL
jgi:hypothetical protein